ncbi:MAG TPA: DUF1285 domain-containing protein [Brevundimonas sp.]|nr:DUF1285 domain-containing protein [Brevundimonas sp.]
MATDDRSALDRSALAGIAEAAKQAPGRGLPPVHLWNPAHCGEIDIVIRRDGVWMHEGSPIGRPELVRLFSTVLRKDSDGYVLVTPGEKLSIQVEDLPFRAVSVTRRGEGLVFVTDVGDEAEAGPATPILVETDSVSGEPSPSVRVRADLWARIERSIFYDLVEMATVQDGRLSVTSNGCAFPLGPTGAGLE